ncbi:MAG: thiamine phosphate synthase [Pseudomonadota bacterium]
MAHENFAIRLMLILPAECTPQDAVALAVAGDVAAVIARCGDTPAERERLAALAPLLQEAGAAVLVEDRPDLVVSLGLDGAHLSGRAGLKAALPALKPALIAGVGGLADRHDAMEAGEAGADYLLFGGTGLPFAQVLDSVSWWAELFEVPCVGLASDLSEVASLAGAGVDFVALTGALLTPQGVAEAQARVRAVESDA